jgi:ubiquinol-cytochrome c reductase cytochrome c1 subunit
MKKLKSLFALLALCAAGMVAASGGGVHLNSSPHEERDAASLQRGAQLFMNYCSGCHTAQFVRYNRLTEIGLTEKQIIDNLMLDKSKKIGDTITNSLTKDNAKAWFGAVPPDLSVISRSYGADRLYSYLRGFYRDDSRPTGWNNLVSPNIGMPHVLADLSGVAVLKTQSFDKASDADAAGVLNKGLWSMASHDGKTTLSSLEVSAPGKLNPQQYDAAIADLTNFIAWIGEPYKRDRVAIGIWMLIFLTFLAFIAYWLKAEYWKDVH